jgi:hypothetical protein
MTQAEQVKARIVQAVTGQAVVPSIQAEASTDEGWAGNVYVGDDAKRKLPNAAFKDKPDAQSAPSRAPEQDEALDAFRLGFANVYVYRAFKELEARVAKLEGQ